MDLNDIRTFVSVAEAGTFSGAAAELKLPTSTISRAITRLEQNIGTLLCKRTPRGLTLTDAGNEYLAACKSALRSLRDGRDLLEKHRDSPQGLIRIGCPVTLARDVLGPILKHFVEMHPGLRVEIEPYSKGFDDEPRENVDIYFKLKAPRDSGRRVRCFPGTARGLFASPDYLEAHGTPENPLALEQHRCIGSGVWKLTMGKRIVAPELVFHIVVSDPGVHLQLACTGAGIAVLPLWMASRLVESGSLVPVLPLWKPQPITVCALYTGTAKLTPKVSVFFEFVARYFGTELDPRLGDHRPDEFFTDLHLPATPGP